MRLALQDRENALAAARTEYLESKQRAETGRGEPTHLTAARQAFETAEAERNRTLADLKTDIAQLTAAIRQLGRTAGRA